VNSGESLPDAIQGHVWIADDCSASSERTMAERHYTNGHLGHRRARCITANGVARIGPAFYDRQPPVVVDAQEQFAGPWSEAETMQAEVQPIPWER
jgi:hypothetical protein